MLALGLTPAEINQRFVDNVYTIEHYLLMQDPVYYWRQDEKETEEMDIPVGLSEEDKQMLAEHGVKL